MMHDRQITDHSTRLRMEWANSLAYALGECHPDDAAAICAAFLETVETGGPMLGDPFGITVSDARLWAAAAPPHELVAYTLAGLAELPRAHVSNAAGKRLFVAIWGRLPDADRRAFLARVDPDGQFHGGKK